MEPVEERIVKKMSFKSREKTEGVIDGESEDGDCITKKMELNI